MLKPDQFELVQAHRDGAKHAIRLALSMTQRTTPTIVDLALTMLQISEEDYIDAKSNIASLAPVSAIALGPETGRLSGRSDLAEDTSVADGSDIMDAIRDAYPRDDDLQSIMKAKRTGMRRLPLELLNDRKFKIELGDCQIADDLLYVKGRLYIPDDDKLRTEVIRLGHQTYCGGHSGKHGTYAKLGTWYYWPRMTTTIAKYIRNCLACKRTKSYRDAKHGLLHPLPIPDRYWMSISMDFITALPQSIVNGRSYTDILVIVDRLSKKKKFIPVVNLRVETLVQAFLEYVWREEGFPEQIVSDRGTQFISHFWNRLCQRLKIKPKLSTAYHPETDGQTENANAYLKQYLRAFVAYDQDDWATYLPMAEFEANCTVSASTGVAPFVAKKDTCHGWASNPLRRSRARPQRDVIRPALTSLPANSMNCGTTSGIA